MSTPRLALAFLTLFSLAACSGSGGRGTSQDASNLDLFVNTGTGSEMRITGRLSVVALEAADASLTGDLLPGDPEIVLSDPVPELTGLRLDDAPPGTYVAVHLAFASQELVGVTPDQQVVITIPQRDFRLPLNRPLVITSGPQSWFTMHHVGPIQLVPAGSGLTWTPTWVAEAAEVELVRDARVRVDAFSAQRFTVDGRLLGCGERRVVVDLSRADSLVRDAAEITREAFFAQLRAGEVMMVEGWLDKGGHILAIAASIDDDVDSRRLPKSKVRGEIVDVSAERLAFGLLVTRVLRDHANLPVTRPLQLTVRVDEDTRIKWVPRHGLHRGHLPFSALQPGMVVDVAWFGPAPGLEVTARKVDIKTRARCDVPGVVIGEIDAVDVEAGTFTVSGRGAFPLRLGARRFESLVVVVDEASFMVRHDDGRHTRIGLDALPVGGRVLMVVEPIEGDRVRAVLVHVR